MVFSLVSGPVVVAGGRDGEAVLVVDGRHADGLVVAARRPRRSRRLHARH